MLQAITDIRTIITIDGNAEEKLNQIDTLLQSLEKQVHLQEQPETSYIFLEAGSLKLQKIVSDIIRQVEFNEDTSDKDLMQAILYFKKRNGDIDKNVPINFLED